MKYSHGVERMCTLNKDKSWALYSWGEDGLRLIRLDISGLTHGVGWCAPQQGTCKLT